MKTAQRIEAFPVTEAEVAQWMKECDEGKHPLSHEDEQALERSRAKLFRRLKSYDQYKRRSQTNTPS